MKLKFLIFSLVVSINTNTISYAETNFECKDVRLNFKKMSRAMEKLKKDQIFIFPEKLTSFIDIKENIPENLNQIFTDIQREAFGKDLLKLRTVRSGNASTDSFNKSVDYDPKFIGSLTKENGYTDPESLLRFIFAHEVSHFIQDFIALNKQSMLTENGMILISDSAEHFHSDKLYTLVEAQAKRSGIKDPTSDDTSVFAIQVLNEDHVEVDGYAYLLLKKLNYKLPNVEDFKKMITKISGGTILSTEGLFAPARCGFEQRKNLLINLGE